MVTGIFHSKASYLCKAALFNKSIHLVIIRNVMEIINLFRVVETCFSWKRKTLNTQPTADVSKKDYEDSKCFFSFSYSHSIQIQLVILLYTQE